MRESETERDRERQRDRHIDVRQQRGSVATCVCPHQELNPQPFGVRDDAPTNLATWQGHGACLFSKE